MYIKRTYFHPQICRPYISNKFSKIIVQAVVHGPLVINPDVLTVAAAVIFSEFSVLLLW